MERVKRDDVFHCRIRTRKCWSTRWQRVLTCSMIEDERSRNGTVPEEGIEHGDEARVSGIKTNLMQVKVDLLRGRN